MNKSVYLYTETAMKQAEECYKKTTLPCSGDVGDVRCIFCPGCVLDMEETYHMILDHRNNMLMFL